VDALAVIGLGVGVYLMYAAYKNQHPWTLAQAVIGGGGGKQK